MAVSAFDILKLRRMIDEPTTATYSDALLTAYIENYPTIDERGVAPYYYDVSTDPPTQVATTGWYPSFDLHAAASDLWAEKAAAFAEHFDYTDGEGTTHYKSKVYEQYMKSSRYHAARKRIGTITLIPWPSGRRTGDSWIGNLAEQDN